MENDNNVPDDVRQTALVTSIQDLAESLHYGHNIDITELNVYCSDCEVMLNSENPDGE